MAYVLCSKNGCDVCGGEIGIRITHWERLVNPASMEAKKLNKKICQECWVNDVCHSCHTVNKVHILDQWDNNLRRKSYTRPPPSMTCEKCNIKILQHCGCVGWIKPNSVICSYCVLNMLIKCQECDKDITRQVIYIKNITLLNQGMVVDNKIYRFIKCLECLYTNHYKSRNMIHLYKTEDPDYPYFPPL